MDAAAASASFSPIRARDHALAEARRAVTACDCAGPGQQMGQRWPVGCIALEITQRCNLDCTLCYLSEHSEAVHDLPLDEVYRRIDQIREHYGTGVDVQITGGDPTLRPRDELVAITRRLTEQGQRTTLMTNGICADRELLGALADAGLTDIAFHVDTTQGRRGYASESALDALRLEYLSRARECGLSVMFNTTVHGANLDAVAGIARFFLAHAGEVRTAAFQIQADTGRGTLRGRPDDVNASAIWSRIEEGVGARLRHDVSFVGHPRCNRYGLALVSGGRAFDAFDEPRLVADLQAATAHIRLDRRSARSAVRAFAGWLATHPLWTGSCLGWAARKAWRMRRALLASRGRVDTLSFFVHDFMHEHALERERLDACVFKVMTAHGPLSMCLHNAKRDDYILAPIALADGRLVDPLTGRAPRSMPVSPPDPARHGLKRSKGRTRRRLLELREERE